MEFYIDLQKAQLNFGKLIKRAVQVRGKNGKVFTRMQWVNPEQASTGHGVRKISSPEDMATAMRHGVHRHPDYAQALKDQGINDKTHDHANHPPFYLPETESSSRLAQAMELDNHIPHGESVTLGGNKEMHEEPEEKTSKSLHSEEKGYSELVQQLERTWRHNSDHLPIEEEEYQQGIDFAHKILGNFDKGDLENELSVDGVFNTTLNMSMSTESDAPTLEMNMTMTDSKGNFLGSAKRALFHDDYEDALHVKNQLFEVDEKHQGKGIGEHLYANSERLWEHMGKQLGKPVHVGLYANISVGVYAWAKKGFDFADEWELETAHEEFQEFVENNDIDLDSVLKTSGYRDVSEIKTARQFAELEDEYDYSCDDFEHPDGETNLKGYGNIGKMFMLFGKGGWEGVKKLGEKRQNMFRKSDTPKKVKEIKWTKPYEQKGTEGLVNGSDLWLHRELMEKEHKPKPASWYLANKSEMLYIDISKAFNFSKLVKRAVQVHGKNGRVFTRMQWVSPEEASTGMGMRQINTKEGLQRAIKDGIDKHPDYQRALHEQGVHPDLFEDHHPHFFLPETEESYSNRDKRIDDMYDKGDFDAVDEDTKHGFTHEHGVKINHKIYKDSDFDNTNPEEEHEKFLQKYGLHPEIKHVVEDAIKKINPDNGSGDLLDYVGEAVEEHWHTIASHVRDHIEQSTDDEHVKKMQLQALEKGNMRHRFSMAAHPIVARESVNHILGMNLANKLRKDMDSSSLSINFPKSAGRGIKKDGYVASTAETYIKKQAGTDLLDRYHKYLEDTKGQRESERIDNLPKKIDPEYNHTRVVQEVQTRARAEYNAVGVGLEDPKPTYVAYNPASRPEGAADFYGERWMSINKDVLKHCTLTMDDSFYTTESLAKVWDMDHMKDIFILKQIAIDPHSMDALKNGDAFPKDWQWHDNAGDIPLELQYHKPKLEPSQFEIVPTADEILNGIEPFSKDEDEKYKGGSNKYGIDLDDLDDFDTDDEDFSLDDFKDEGNDDLDDLDLDDFEDFDLEDDDDKEFVSEDEDLDTSKMDEDELLDYLSSLGSVMLEKKLKEVGEDKLEELGIDPSDFDREEEEKPKEAKFSWEDFLEEEKKKKRIKSTEPFSDMPF